MAVFNEPTKWQTSLVNSGDANTIPQNTPVGTGKASFDDGFPQITQVPISAGGIAPDRKDFNGLFKVLGDWIFFLQNGGVSTYSESFDYVAGRVVSYNDNIYKCIQANGVSSTVVTPDSGTEYWQRIDNFVRSVNGVNADADGNVEFHDYLPLTGGNVTGNLTVQNKNVATEEFVNNIKINIIKKNDGNDYYDDSDITSLIYAGSEEGTIRNEIANGNFSRVHPGQTIVGRVTGTTYIVVGCNIYLHRGDTELTRNHIGLMPIQLVGNTGNLLWSGRTYAGSDVNNTNQGYAPWASDNNTEGKNQTSCYKDSYIANTVLPKVDNLWLKPDFENQGISILTFRSLDAISFDTNATCMSNPNWRGCATNWGWTSRRLVLPSEPEIYGHYHWAGSPFESGSQHTQLPLYRHKEIHKVYPRIDIWLKDSASASRACIVSSIGRATASDASVAVRVCPLFLIA